jgi:TonB family protein
MKQVFLILILFIFCVAARAQKAEVVNFVAPEKYPLAAMAVRATGEVVVEVQIDANGQVIGATAIKGHPLLRGVSEKTALKWQFSKALAESKTVIQLIFDYRIGEWKAIESSEKETDTAIRSNHPSPFRLEVIGDTLIPKLLLLERENGEIPPEICEAHKQIMQVEIQDVIYGDDDESGENEDDFWEVKEELFPHANVRTLGGNNDYEIKIRRKEVHFCHICRIKREEWLKENR